MGLEIKLTESVKDFLLFLSRHSKSDSPEKSHLLGLNGGHTYTIFGAYVVDGNIKIPDKDKELLKKSVGNVIVYPDRIDFILSGGYCSKGCCFSMSVNELKYFNAEYVSVDEYHIEK